MKKKRIILGLLALSMLFGGFVVQASEVVATTLSLSAHLNASRPPIIGAIRGSSFACSRSGHTLSGMRIRTRVYNTDGTTTIASGNEWRNTLAANESTLIPIVCSAQPTALIIGTTRTGTVRGRAESRQRNSSNWLHAITAPRSW